MPQIVEAIAKSRREANRIKREQPITVVIGNPPYKEKAEGRGGWIEKGSDGRPAPLDRWKAPAEWGVGAHGKHLKNLYVYFWRWATLKVFGSGRMAATGLPDTDEEGIICFITVAGFLNGPGFEKMRDDLRRTCSDIWVIDCSPEGHQPDVPTRIFQGVQQPVCIVLAARTLGKNESKPAHVRFRALPKGKREEKFAALAALSLDTKDWIDCPADWRAPFLPELVGNGRILRRCASFSATTARASCPAERGSSRLTRKRLESRWERLVKEKDEDEEGRSFFIRISRRRRQDSTKASKVGLGGHRVSLAFRSRTIRGRRLRPDALCLPQFRSAVDHSGRSADQSAESDFVESVVGRQIFVTALGGAVAEIRPRDNVYDP